MKKNEILKKKKLILFDLDGVLIDSIENMEKAWIEVSKKHGLKNEFSEYREYIGIPFNEIMKEMGLARQAYEIERDYKFFTSKFNKDINWTQGAKKLLTSLYKHGKKIGIVTSKDILRTGSILSLLNIEFSTIQTPSRNARGKPNPDPIYRALIESEIDIGDAIFIGDMESDCICAKRAGIDYIHFRGGYGLLSGCNALYQIDKLEELDVY